MDVATKENFVKNKEVTRLYVDYYVENETKANELYTEMLVVARQHMCKVINRLSTEDFIDWVKETFKLQRKGEKDSISDGKGSGYSCRTKG